MYKDTIKIKSKNGVLMVAHRGVSEVERENTCPAFLAAALKSYYGIETDVHVTADGKYILYHDDNLKRLANMPNVVEQTEFDTLHKIVLPDLDGSTERRDLYLPGLEEYIAICKKYGKEAVLELKNLMPRENILEICKIIKDLGWFEHTTFITFGAQNILYMREEYKDAKVQYLVMDITDDAIAFAVANNCDIDSGYKNLSREWIDKCHKNGIKVNCWTVNTVDEAERLISYGVDYITSNILE